METTERGNRKQAQELLRKLQQDAREQFEALDEERRGELIAEILYVSDRCEAAINDAIAEAAEAAADDARDSLYSLRAKWGEEVVDGALAEVDTDFDFDNPPHDSLTEIDDEP